MKPVLREVGITPDESLAKAKALIEADDAGVVMRGQDQRELHMGAAEFIADAMKADRKLTQKKVAEFIGKSVGWVSMLLAWRAKGYATPTAFGPQAKEAREKKSSVETEHDGDECPTCHLPEGRDRRHATIREEKYRAAGLKDRVARITEDQRDELVMLLVDLADESKRADAADKIVAFRSKLGVLWSDLIVSPEI